MAGEENMIDSIEDQLLNELTELRWTGERQQLLKQLYAVEQEAESRLNSSNAAVCAE